MGKTYSRERLDKLLRDLVILRAEVRSYYNSEHMMDISEDISNMSKWVVISATLGDLQNVVTYYLTHQGSSAVE